MFLFIIKELDATAFQVGENDGGDGKQMHEIGKSHENHLENSDPTLQRLARQLAENPSITIGKARQVPQSAIQGH